MKNLIFYDTETTGVKELDFLQVIQFAAIQTTSDFHTLNRFEQLCSPLPWTLVSPKALLVNKKSQIFQSDVNHYQLITNIYKTWTEWTNLDPGIFVTYNGMRFDEEVMRRQFYWNLYDPYFTNTNGNTRLDLFLKMFVIAHFYNKYFPVPVREDQLSLKLEDLAKALSLDVSNAHDALADCIFLKELMKSISVILPNYYKEIMSSISKDEVIKSLKEKDVHFNCYFIPRSKTTKSYPFTALLSDYALNKYVPVFNLSKDPELFVDLSYLELESIISNPKESPFKRISTNKTLPIISLETLQDDNIEIQDADLYRKRAGLIRSNEGFIEKVLDIYNSIEFSGGSKTNIEEQIYSNGFPSAIDKDRLSSFHNATTYEQKLVVINSFDDERYKEFGYRICAQEYADKIDTNLLLNLKELVYQRFNEEGPWPNAEKNLQEAKILLEETTAESEKKLLQIAINSIENSL
jgi:exodeoxyribonuclease-1